MGRSRWLVHDPCAYLRPADHADIVDGYLKMPHMLTFVQIRQMGVRIVYSVGVTPKARQPLLDRSSQNSQLVCIKPT